MTRRPATALLVLAGLGASPAIAAAQTPAAVAGSYEYHTRAGDTLIGLGKRLLKEPSHWHDLQVMNRVERPRQMPRDTPLEIPYSWLRLTPESAQVVACAGDARAAGRPVALGERLPEGTVLETEASGSVTLSMPDGSILTVQKSSRLELERLEHIDGLDAHDVSFRLTAGRIETKVQAQRDVGRFEIHTPVAVTAVRGTQFRATFDTSDSDARTETLEGVVGVSANHALVPVAQGYGTRVEQGAAPSAPVVLPAPPALDAVPDVNPAADLDVRFAAVPGAVRYRVQLSADEHFYALARDEEVAEPALRVADLADGVYWLRVRSITAAGLEGPDAARRIVERRAPAAPAPSQPAAAANIPGRQTSFAWAGSAGAQTYAFELARDADFAQVVRARSDLARPGVDITDLDAGPYYWRAAGINADGNRGAWSEPVAYHQRALAPQPAAVLADGRADVTWESTGAQGYTVEVAHDEAFLYPVDRATVTGTQWRSDRLHCGTYFVRVRPVDGDGYAGAPGAARELRVPYPAWLKFAPLALVLPFL